MIIGRCMTCRSVTAVRPVGDQGSDICYDCHLEKEAHKMESMNINRCCGCGYFRDVRPLGPNNKDICYDCLIEYEDDIMDMSERFDTRFEINMMNILEVYGGKILSYEDAVKLIDDAEDKCIIQYEIYDPKGAI